MRIENQKGRKDGNSGYGRVLGNQKFGELLSRVQATVISNGSELERLIASRSNIIEDLPQFMADVTNGEQANGIYLCLKKTLKKASTYAEKVAGIEPDMIVFSVAPNPQCRIIELKDGDAFDTKKATAEKQNLENFATKFGSMIPFVTSYHICCFNQENKQAILEGFKHRFPIENIMTGRELCMLLGIDYQEIISLRQNDAEENFDYFIKELLEIPEIKEKICSELSERIDHPSRL